MTPNLIKACDDWVEACNNWTENDSSVRGIVRLTDTAQKLIRELLSLINPPHVASYHISSHVATLTGQFLCNFYTDSNTDEPCDVEWDIHNLMHVLDLTYEIPDYVKPAYVGITYFSTPEV